MKDIMNRVSIIFTNNFDNGKPRDIIKYILSVNQTIENVDNYSSLEISCEQVQMKTNTINKIEKESLEQSQDGTEFLIFKN